MTAPGITIAGASGELLSNAGGKNGYERTINLTTILLLSEQEVGSDLPEMSARVKRERDSGFI